MPLTPPFRPFSKCFALQQPVGERPTRRKMLVQRESRTAESGTALEADWSMNLLASEGLPEHNIRSMHLE